ncbi:MAG TPA: NADH-quinone oxidoreductase subunit M, partial [Gammaproteobacteria bacterium]
MFAGWPLLSLVVWIPIIGGVVVLLSGDKGSADGARRLALIFSIVTFILSLGLYSDFDTTTAQMQFVERFEWIGAYNIFYHLGVDGISMPLIILTTFTTVLVIIAGWEVIKDRPSQYMAAFLIMAG